MQPATTQESAVNKTFVLRNAKIGTRFVDVWVEDGFIKNTAHHGSDDALHMPTEIPQEDGTGLKIFPSFIDAHVHLREPGFEYKEDIASGLNAAAHGGFGAVLCMANTNPVNDNASVTRLMLDAAKRAYPHGGVRLYPVGALTVGLEGKGLAPMAELKEAGCVAFSNDGRPVTNTEIFRRALEYANDQGCPVIDHCEDEFLGKGGDMNESALSGLMGLKGQPCIAETIQVYRDILLAQYLNAKVHLAHISTAQSMAAIFQAKGNRAPVTAETCPHYLFLDESAVENYNTAAKVNPPLRTPEDVQGVREALSNGTIDIRTTDHAPHAAHEKETPFDEAPFGISGLDSAVSLTWELVRDGVINETDMVRLWCHGPARIFGLPVNTFQPGASADFFLFDPNEIWKLTPENMYSKSKNTPFLGREMFGRVKAHWVGGVKVA